MGKVNARGIRVDAARWIGNSLAGRRQRVFINQTYSNWALVTSGVPNGSVFLLMLLLKKVGNATLGKSDLHPIRPKTQPHNTNV